jgi:hypothetical protein
MSGDKQAAIKAGGTRPAPKPAFGPVPTGPSERTIRSMEAGPAKVKGGMSQQSTLSSKPGANAAANAAKTQAGKDAARMANRTAKGYGQPSALETNIRNTVGTIRSAAQLAGRGGAFAAGIQAYNTGAGTLDKMAPQVAKQIAAMKNKVGPKKVGPKKVGTGKVGTIAQSFDKSFAAARKAGKSEFTFQGKRYNTKMK